MAITIGHSDDGPKRVHDEIAVVVHFKSTAESDSESDYRLNEFLMLADSAGATVVDVQEGTLRAINPATWMGSGKLEELKHIVREHEAALVLINGDLSPVQERNIERAIKCRLLTRTGLILDIFAARAKSHEGKLQVELAQLEHVSTRLVRGWTHLERQKGGIGLRGPGETQLEMDKRMIGVRMKQLKAKLAKVSSARELRRSRRKRIPIPTVSLVGYTNAGKSTLFNRLTQADVYAADQLFATLDPTMRRLDLPSGREAVLSDTVGFVSDLPHQLVNAFHSTLEEVVQADLLLHVVDSADARRDHLIEDVQSVLDELYDDDEEQPEMIYIYNKSDLLDGLEALHGKHIALSAKTGEGIDDLLAAIDAFINRSVKLWNIDLAPEEGDLRAQVYRNCRVIEEQYDEVGHCHLLVEASERIAGQLDRQKKWLSVN